MTAEVDPSSACYVRFYHENFQRDKPELLSQIKRATKGDQQSKDDLDTLRMEICGLKEALRSTVIDYDRKLAELSYEYNRRITSMNQEYDKLAALVQQVLGANVTAMVAASAALPPATSGGNFFLNGNVATSILPPPVGSATTHAISSSFPQAVAALPSESANSQANPPCADLLHSLSQVAVSLHDESERKKRATCGRSQSVEKGYGGTKKTSRAKRDQN